MRDHNGQEQPTGAHDDQQKEPGEKPELETRRQGGFTPVLVIPLGYIFFVGC